MRYIVKQTNKYNDDGEPLYTLDRQCSLLESYEVFTILDYTKEELLAKLFNLSMGSELRVKFKPNFTAEMFNNRNKTIKQSNDNVLTD